MEMAAPQAATLKLGILAVEAAQPLLILALKYVEMELLSAYFHVMMVT